MGKRDLQIMIISIYLQLTQCSIFVQTFTYQKNTITITLMKNNCVTIGVRVYKHRYRVQMGWEVTTEETFQILPDCEDLMICWCNVKEVCAQKKWGKDEGIHSKWIRSVRMHDAAEHFSLSCLCSLCRNMLLMLSFTYPCLLFSQQVLLVFVSFSVLSK